MTDLSRHELLALREIRLTGRTSQKFLVRQLLDEEIIVDTEGWLDLTSKGRSLLVRGSPSLWERMRISERSISNIPSKPPNLNFRRDRQRQKNDADCS